MTLKNGVWFASLWHWSFHNESLVTPSPASKRAEALTGMWIHSYGRRPHPKTRRLTLSSAIEKMLKYWPAVRLYFPSVGKEGCPPMWSALDENGEQDYRKTESTCCSSKTVMTFEKARRSLEKGKLTTPQRFNAMCRLWRKLNCKMN